MRCASTTAARVHCLLFRPMARWESAQPTPPPRCTLPTPWMPRFQFKALMLASRESVTCNAVAGLDVTDSLDAEVSIQSTDVGSHRWTLQRSRVSGNVALD